MRLGRALGAVLALLVTAMLLASSAPAAGQQQGVSISVERARLVKRLGAKFSFESTITNHGSTAATGLIEHLNVLSLRNGVYVDPEDWSSNRTRYLEPIPPGGSVTTTWQMQAVNDGTFGIYVAVLPESGAPRPPITTPTIHLEVAKRRTLNPEGMVPIALGMPAFLGLLTLVVRFRRRRLA